jgi:hypothetical protein
MGGGTGERGVKSLIVLDNEAVQALGYDLDEAQVLSLVQVVAQRKRRAAEVALAVPTTVRAQAGWDRTVAAWALANRLRVADEALGRAEANVAAQIRAATGVSVADAHLGAVLQGSKAQRVTVLTSDPGDVAAVAGSRAVTIVRI